MNAPDLDLLQPLSENPALEAELNRAADLIARLRNYGTTQLRALMESRTGEVTADEAFPLLMAFGLLRWGLELLSALEQQLRHGWTDPAKITIRSLFECMLAAKHLLQVPAERARRARAYRFVELMKSRAFLMTRLPGTEARKKAEALAKRDEFHEALLAALPEDRVKADLQSVENEMTSAGMAEVAAEAERLRKGSGGNGRKRINPDWYEFFDGPHSLEVLADRNGYALCYEVLYRRWSQSAHATAVVGPAVRVHKGEVELLALRHPTDLDEVKVYAFVFGRELFRAVAVLLSGDFDKEFAAWYAGQQADFLRRVSFVDSKGGRAAVE
jgi:hypothetical protein